MIYGTYELSESQQAKFGIEQVSAMYEGMFPQYVINHPENGVLAGDRILTWKNIHFDRDQPASPHNREFVSALTDDYSAEVSINAAERRRERERNRLQNTIVHLADMAFQLSKSHFDPVSRERAKASLTILAGHDARAFDPDKRLAVDDMERLIRLVDSRGSKVPDISREKLERVMVRMSRRDLRLERQTRVNSDRLDNLQFALAADHVAKLALNALSTSVPSINLAPETRDLFLKHARTRTTKPGNLSVNNAWYHRDDADSWIQLRNAQIVFEGVYPDLMRAMSALSNETKDGWDEDPEAAYAQYLLALAATEDAIDISGIGGDYNTLGYKLLNYVFAAEELLMERRFIPAIELAKEYKDFLRYRALPGHPAPKNWYTLLDGVKTKPDPFQFSQEILDNPFHGLPGN